MPSAGPRKQTFLKPPTPAQSDLHSALLTHGATGLVRFVDPLSGRREDWASTGQKLLGTLGLSAAGAPLGSDARRKQSAVTSAFFAARRSRSVQSDAPIRSFRASTAPTAAWSSIIAARWAATPLAGICVWVSLSGECWVRARARSRCRSTRNLSRQAVQSSQRTFWLCGFRRNVRGHATQYGSLSRDRRGCVGRVSTLIATSSPIGRVCSPRSGRQSTPAGSMRWPFRMICNVRYICTSPRSGLDHSESSATRAPWV